MIPATPARMARRGAVGASTVFAIALAIVAGLIFAWLFKIYLFDKPKAKPTPEVMESVALATANIFDKTQILPIHVRTIRVSKATYDGWVRDRGGKRPLAGNQPVGRVTKKSLSAEFPIWDEDLLPFEYPASIASKIKKPGNKAVQIEIPAREGMVQVDDVVDLHITMANDAFGAAGNATARIAKDAPVIARFGTTRPGAQPARADAPRQYTLEVTPYRFALIELAKQFGAKFSIAVTSSAVPEDDNRLASAAGAPPAKIDPERDVVTPADLAELFQIQPAPPPGPPPPPPFTLERYSGLHLSGTQPFPGYNPPRSAPPAVVPAASTAPAPAAVPALNLPGPAAPVTPAGNRQSAAPAFNPRTAVVSRGSGTFGFRAATGPGCGTGA